MAEIKHIETGTRMSQAVVHGGVVWLAGRCGSAGESIKVQTRESLAKIDRLLAKVGSDKTRILNTTTWLANIDDYDEINAVWDAWMPDGCSPARACGESRLAGTGYGIEIICVAAVG